MADILVIDDQDRTFRLCQRIMPEHHFLGPLRSWAEVQAFLGTHALPDLALLDLHFDIPEGDLLGLEGAQTESALRGLRRRQGALILQAIRARWAELPIMLMTARGVRLERVAEEYEAEEYTYFLDDIDLDSSALRAQVASVLTTRRVRESDGPIFWGRSRAMQRLRSRLALLARARLPVILGGPTGSGKSLVARHFIHPRSGRKGRFVAVDLASIPPDLVAARLFGSVRGAYTGATSDRVGAFVQADGGTLFLDEVANLPPAVQRMLLTVLQERVVTPLGSTEEIPVDVKVVSATHADLRAMVAEGRFRADLLQRLNPAATVALPSLQERPEDLYAALAFVVRRLGLQPQMRDLISAYRARVRLPEMREGSALEAIRDVQPMPDGVLGIVFPAVTMSLLSGHAWPGNLRELSMVVENAVSLALAEAIEAGPTPGRAAAEARADLVQVRPKVVRDLLLGGALPPGEDADDPAEGGFRARVDVVPAEDTRKAALDFERQIYTQLYQRLDGDFRAMAEVVLGGPEHETRLRNRFNSIGLSARALRRSQR